MQSDAKIVALVVTYILWLETIALVHHILSRSYCVLHQGFCDQRVSWSSLLDELKNFTANIFLKLVC